MTTKAISYAVVGGAIFIVGSYAALLIFLTWPIDELSIGKAGGFGDSFGILTSLFSALAFAGLILTILLQRDELSLQREELKETRKEIAAQKEILKNQNFNNSFFSLLRYYKENLTELMIVDNDSHQRYQGIEALIFLQKRLVESQKEYQVYYVPDDEESLTVFEFFLCINIRRVLLRQARYLETFNSLLLMIDEDLGEAGEKQRYWNVIESQLTAHELKYIFYQALVDIEGEFAKRL